MPANKSPILTFSNVWKEYKYSTHSLRDVNLQINHGEFVFVCGRTGAGKSTFLKLIMREQKPTKGTVEFEGRDLSKLKNSELPYLRRQIGMVQQGTGLFLEHKTAAENLEFVMRATGHEEDKIKDRARRALGMVGMARKGDCVPEFMSIGERKRIEIARALLNNPRLLIADEPTASLDGDLSWDIMNLFNDINHLGVTVVVVTHDREMVNLMRKRVLTFSEGKLLGDVKNGRYGDII